MFWTPFCLFGAFALLSIPLWLLAPHTIRGLDKKIRVLDRDRNTLSEENEALRREVNELQTETQRLQQGREELRNENQRLERGLERLQTEKERLERKLATMASQLDDRQQRQQLIKQIEDYASRCRNMRNLETAQSLQAEIEPFLGEHFGPSTKQQFHEIIYRVTGKDDWPNMSPEAQRHACKELVGKAAAKFLDDLAENIREGG